MFKKIKKSIVNFLEKVTDALSYERVAKKYFISGRFYSWLFEDKSGKFYKFIGFSFDGENFGDVIFWKVGEKEWRYGAIHNSICEDYECWLCNIYGKVSTLGYASWRDVFSYLSYYRNVSAKIKDATISSLKPISLIRTPEYTEAIFKVKEFIEP